MRRNRTTKYVTIVAFCCLGLMCACRTVKPYQRAYLNDTDMQLGAHPAQQFEQGVHSYRESAAGGRNGKASGGCGCN